MSTASYKLPSLVGKALSLLPAYPGSLLFVRGLNFALTRHLSADVLDLLAGRSLRIQVRDARVAFDFVYRNGAFMAARHQDEIALTISADAYDFLLLARRAEDPDTLFFSRRLTMEGDTELGLLVKNSLDAIEFPVFSLDRFEPARMFRRGN
jgi:O2-independent ubiquinone biosynthesis accessory factor UbiT